MSDLAITNLHVRLEPGDGRAPLLPAVTTLGLSLSSDAFAKIIRAGLGMAAGKNKLPVDVELTDARLVPGGAEITARAKKSILKADVRARLDLGVENPAAIRIRIAELDGPAWLPVQMVIANAIGAMAARPGFSRVPGDDRAVDFDPAALLDGFGLPLRLVSPGAWSVEAADQQLRLSYAGER
jgi:hypothetical protein